MALKEFHCLHCGAPLEEIRPDGTYHCAFCDHVFKDKSLQKEMETIEAMFEGLLVKQKEEQIANTRRNLYEAVHEKYIDSGKVVSYCREMKKLLPDDFQANFYEVANSGTPVEINRFLDTADVVENDIYASDIVEFMIRSLDSKNVLSVKSFIERGKASSIFDSRQYTDLMTRVEEEADKLEEGIYSTIIPRDVFIAYSSADIAEVNEVVNFLEENEISCFTALRNLRHGRGAKENYISALQSAIHNCKCVVFLSSENSRRLSCDALRVELPYIRDHEKKMGRIEYIINDYGTTTSKAAKLLLESFFSGLEYCRTLDDLLSRVLQYTTGILEDEKRKAEEELERQKKELEIQRIALEESKKRQEEEYRKKQEELARQQQEQYLKQQEELIRKQQEELDKIRQQYSRPTVASAPTSGVEFYDRNKFKITGTILEWYRGNDEIVEIPNGVTDIAKSAFAKGRMMGVVIPDSVVYIGNNAFEECPNLLAIYLPSSIKQMGSNVFAKCNKELTVCSPVREKPSLWDSNFAGGSRVVWSYKGTAEKVLEEAKRLKQERIEKRRLEEERIAKQKAVKERLEREVAEAVRRENERVAKEKEKAEREARRREEERLAKEKAEKERLEREAAEARRLEEERLAKEREEAEKEARRLAEENAEKGRIAELFDISSTTLVKYKGLQENVVIPNGIETIGEKAFKDCKSIVNVTIPDGVKTIDKWAFDGCSNLSHITLPDSVTSLNHAAFSDCENLTKVVFPKGLISTGDYIFFGCHNLNDVKLPEGLKTIGNSVFYQCKNLTNIYIPESVTTIGESAFAHCTSLENIVIPCGLAKISGHLFYGCSSLQTIDIPKDVTRIGEWAFKDCESLKNVVIPNKVISIGKETFDGCSNLQFAYISSSVSIIGPNTFNKCDSALTLYTPWKRKPESWNPTWNNDFCFVVWNYKDSPEEALLLDRKIKKAFNFKGSVLVRYKGNEENVVIPDGTLEIGENAFENCNFVKIVTIPSSVIKIGKGAFVGTTNLEAIHISDLSAWCRIEFKPGYYTNPLARAHNLYLNGNLIKELTIPSDIQKIGDNCFYGSSFEKIVIPGTVKTIGKDAFKVSKSLTDVTLSNGVERIQRAAFASCSALKNLTLTKSMTNIGEWAFSECTSLTNLIIPKGVARIDKSAFYGCLNLTSAMIPSSVTIVGEDAFMECEKLTVYCGANSKPTYWNSDWNIYKKGIIFTKKKCKVVWNSKEADKDIFEEEIKIQPPATNKPQETQSYKAKAEEFFEISDSTLIQYYGYEKNIAIPNGIKRIGKKAFYFAEELISIQIPDSVVYIGEMAFIGSKKLNDVKIPSSVKIIDDFAFKECESLTKVVLPEGVTKIGYRAYCTCKGLTDVVIPNSVVEIGDEAFLECKSLVNVRVPSRFRSRANTIFRNYGSLKITYTN